MNQPENLSNPPPQGIEYFERTEGSPIRWLVGVCFRLLRFVENPFCLFNPIKTMRDPIRRRGGNPWAALSGDYMHDRGDGYYDRVWDERNLPFGWTLDSCEEDPRRVGFGWVPRGWAQAHGDPNDWVWDPVPGWVQRYNLQPGKRVPIRPDQSSGDGSGA